MIEDCRGKQKPLELPTVPDTKCKKGYTYEANLGHESEDETLADDGYNDGLLDVNVEDQRVLLKMAFDET